MQCIQDTTQLTAGFTALQWDGFAPELDRPLDPRSADYHAMHDQLVDLLADEVDRAFAEQERAAG